MVACEGLSAKRAALRKNQCLLLAACLVAPDGSVTVEQVGMPRIHLTLVEQGDLLAQIARLRQPGHA